MTEKDVQPSTTTEDSVSQTILSGTFVSLDRPGINGGSFGQYLSQGAAGGALGYVVSLVGCFVIDPGEFNFLLLVFVPQSLVLGSGVGFIGGGTIWSVTRFVGHSLPVSSRVALGVLSVGLLFLPFLIRLPGHNKILSLALFAVASGVPIGLMVGSQRRPWRLLTWRSSAAGDLLLARILLIALRIIVISGVFASSYTLYVLASAQYPAQTLVGLFIFCHFILSLILLFVKIEPLLTTITAILLNSPIAFFLIYWWNESELFRPYVIPYLALWFLFLLARSKWLTNLIGRQFAIPDERNEVTRL